MRAWPIPFLICQDTEDRSGAVRRCKSIQSEGVYVSPLIKANLWESPFDLFDKARINGWHEITDIEEFIRYNFVRCWQEEFQKKLNGKPRIDSSWVHISLGKGSYHGTHTHGMSAWSCVYYLSVDGVTKSNSGKNQFYQPYSTDWEDESNEYLTSLGILEFEAQNGGCIFFPSFISHNSTPYFGDEDRIVISCNITVR